MEAMTDETTHTGSEPFWSAADDTSHTVTEALHAQFDAAADDLVVTVVEAVATVTNQEALAMEPLFDTIDATALNELVQSARDREQSLEVSFCYQECRITASSFGTVLVEPLDC